MQNFNNHNVIKATYSENSIIVYQAYNNIIADSALTNQTFIAPPFKLERMSWIKTSFLWMMYRSGWATKENQNRILAIEITKEGFIWALENSVLTSYNELTGLSLEEWKLSLNNKPVRIQWDPERNILLEPMSTRAIQIGLSNDALKNYINNWIISITDITEKCKNTKYLIDSGCLNQAIENIPKEKEYLIQISKIVKKQIILS
ncbi:MAG: DUF4291 domain-containing protein [Sphingobacteriaceae bacterium]|nr:DUF4291 domain-containing protein [Sphingobacteriaceae bacterium]